MPCATSSSFEQSMSPPRNHEIPATQLIRNYLKNRAEFYTVLLPRIPAPAHRQALEMAVGGYDAPVELNNCIENISIDPPQTVFLTSLGLRDLLKKPAAGRVLARTAISLEESLEASELVEETGFILFNHLAQSDSTLAKPFSAEAEKRQTALSALLRLRDDLRYHHFPPILP